MKTAMPGREKLDQLEADLKEELGFSDGMIKALRLAAVAYLRERVIQAAKNMPWPQETKDAYIEAASEIEDV